MLNFWGRSKSKTLVNSEKPNREPRPILPLRQEHVEDARLFANRLAMIQAIPLTEGGRIAEIGTALGDFSIPMIEHFKPSLFAALDIFELHLQQVLWGRPTEEIFDGLNHQQYYEKIIAPYRENCEIAIHVGDSSTNLKTYPDASFDLIYIDGDHSFEGVVKDKDVAVDKLKPDGYLVFNDYIMFDHLVMIDYGIVPIVNELCVNHNWKIWGFAFQDQMFCDICLVRG